MKSMHTLMDSATAEYISDKEACEKDLEGNRKQQRELEEQLKALRDEEEKLKTKISSKDELQKLAVKIREEADRDLVEWRGKIEELGTRTRTALTVMEDMQGELLKNKSLPLSVYCARNVHLIWSYAELLIRIHTNKIPKTV